MKPLFCWTEQYSVGVEEIDQQHQKIFQIIDDLSSCLDGTEQGRSVEDTIMAMIDYVVYHFNTEEQYLAAHPDILSHHRQHDIFAKQVLLFQQTVLDDPQATGKEALLFLQQWLHDHILQQDKKFFKELIAK